MAGEIFLARTEEQDKFRQVLRQRNKGLMQILQTPIFPKPKPIENEFPDLLLFSGEGGMGKTRLSRRLLKIAEGEEEATFKGKFHTLFLDWEEQQKLNLNLQVGHDHIHPETILAVLHADFSRDVEKGEWFATLHREPTSYI